MNRYIDDIHNDIFQVNIGLFIMAIVIIRKRQKHQLHKNQTANVKYDVFILLFVNFFSADNG